MIFRNFKNQEISNFFRIQKNISENRSLKFWKNVDFSIFRNFETFIRILPNFEML